MSNLCKMPTSLSSSSLSLPHWIIPPKISRNLWGFEIPYCCLHPHWNWSELKPLLYMSLYSNYCLGPTWKWDHALCPFNNPLSFSQLSSLFPLFGSVLSSLLRSPGLFFLPGSLPFSSLLVSLACLYISGPKPRRFLYAFWETNSSLSAMLYLDCSINYNSDED